MQKEALKIQGKYKVKNDILISENLTLKASTRSFAKKGTAKRFIGAIDKTKPKDSKEAYIYLSSLYPAGKNRYLLEVNKKHYYLNLLDSTNAEIITRESVPKKNALAFVE